MNGQLWGEVEDAILCDESLTARQVAAKTGRTLWAVKRRRQIIKAQNDKVERPR